MDITLIILIVGWIFVIIWVPIVIATNKKTHPKALFILFGAEMWERFSYYGMRALLTLYMTQVLFESLGQGAADSKALGIYGSYTSMVYLLPVIGGLVADRIFGFRKAVLFGGILMMIGHFSLALEGMLFEGNLPLFFTSLALIIVGNGYFKPNISSFLGKFYDSNDPRKDGAFTIFYMGVNIGAFLATLTCGYVGEKISWHYGFGLAGIGMGLGLLVFWLLGPKYFDGKGLEPDPEGVRRPFFAGLSKNTLVFAGTLLSIPVCASLLNLSDLMSTVLLIISFVIIGYLVYSGVTNKNKKEGQRLLVVVVLFFFHAVFWALFEQAGGSLTLFTLRNVDRSFFGTEIPASIFQSLNPFYIMVLAPLFSWIWISLSNRKKEPSTPMKFVLGLTQLGLGFLIIVLGAKFFANNEGLISVFFLFVMYLLHTTGELSLSPVGLSMITKLSPDKIVGFVMGAWFLSIALANKIAGEIGKLTAADDLGESATAMETLNVYTGIYLNWGVYVVLGAAAILFLLVPTLRRWMHGIH
ncbi:MAG: dihydroorotate dehydrogenase [Saprospiraceae bacterium]|nr:MAG: dihydroorotate dehydrogenase [Saprospiraceae bacterium]